MTMFGEKLLKAVRPNTKVAQHVHMLTITRTVSLEQKMKEQRGFSLNKSTWEPPKGTLFNPEL